MAWPVTEMRKTCELVRLKGKIRSLVLDTLTLRCLSVIEIEMSSRQLDIQVWSSGQRSKKVSDKFDNIIKGVSVEIKEIVVQGLSHPA